VKAIIADLLAYNHESMNRPLSEANVASHDENQSRLLNQSINSSFLPSNDERHPPMSSVTNSVAANSRDKNGDKVPGLTNEHAREMMMVNNDDDDDDFGEENEGGNHDKDPSFLTKIAKTASQDSDFSLPYDNSNQQIYDSSSDSTVNNSRHPSRSGAYTPPIANIASGDDFDSGSVHITPQKQPFVDLPSDPDSPPQIRRPQEDRIDPFSLSNASNTSHGGNRPPYRAGGREGRSLSIQNEHLFSDIDIGIHEYSTFLYRFMDLACTHSEILQIQVRPNGLCIFPSVFSCSYFSTRKKRMLPFTKS
jgi:hypothetical protein